MLIDVVAHEGTAQEADEKARKLSFTGVKVFSATKAREREEISDRITDWLHANRNVEVVDKVVTQSSDREFHCLTITLFYKLK